MTSYLMKYVNKRQLNILHLNAV